jgi:hypothetical protein
MGAAIGFCCACKKHPGEVKLDFMPRALCTTCFSRNIERRVRHCIRLSGLISNQSCPGFLLDESFESMMMKHILERLQKSMPFRIEKRPMIKLYNLDEIVALKLDALLAGRQIPDPIAPLGGVHSKEVELFCTARGLGGRKAVRLNTQQQQLLEELDQFELKHPQLKFSIRNFLTIR